MSQPDASKSAGKRPAATDPEDDWTNVNDPSERRKMQNRIAQRKSRDRARQKREEFARAAEDQRAAGAAYRVAEPHEIETHSEAGVPWGGLSFGLVLAAGKAKEQSSRESSIYAAMSRAGGSSRLGLHLVDRYARGSPAWAAWKEMHDRQDEQRQQGQRAMVMEHQRQLQLQLLQQQQQQSQNQRHGGVTGAT